jgi:hypothetical protein
MIVSEITKGENLTERLRELKLRVLLPEVLNVHTDNAQKPVETLMINEVGEVVKRKLRRFSLANSQNKMIKSYSQWW